MNERIDTRDVARALRDLRMRSRERIWEASARMAQRRGTSSVSEGARVTLASGADVSDSARTGRPVQGQRETVRDT